MKTWKLYPKPTKSHTHAYAIHHLTVYFLCSPFTIRTSLFISLLIPSLLYLQDLEPPLARAGPFHLTHDVTGLTTSSDLPQITVLGMGFPGREDQRWVEAPEETDPQSG